MAHEKIPKAFGNLLRQIRLEEAKVGLRAFAELIDWQPSNLSNLERGRVAPPADPETIRDICDALGLSVDDPRRTEFFDLAARKGVPADVAEAMEEQPGLPVLVRAVANRRLEDEELRELAEHVKKYY